MKYRAIKGTKDILPPESGQWHRTEETLREVMRRFGYREIRTPLFEETSLFARGIGEGTDIVGKEMYTFTDRSETSLTLKPEMTASVVRAYIQHNLGEQSPLARLYYIAPMFRQERPQAGRLRQFHQYGAEAIGGASASIDADIIALAESCLTGCGLSRYAIRINSVGCQECRPAYVARLKEFLSPSREKLSDESRRRLDENVLRILDSKDEGDRAITSSAPLMKDHLCEGCAAHFKELQSALDLMGVKFEIDGRIVRGLDYYTRTAFEITSPDLGSQDALAGGGRYDLLISQLGGKPTPAVGFAAGLERLLIALAGVAAGKTSGGGSADAAAAGTADSGAPSPDAPTLFLAAADDAGRSWCMKAAAGLRGRGLAADTDFLGRSLKAQMREADRLGARYVAVIGGREVETRSAKLKEMRSGSERPVDLGDLGRLAAELAAEVVKELAAGFAAGPSPKRGSR